MLIKHTSTIDNLERDQDIEFFTTLLNSITESYVISLEAPWGSGKSFFIKLWETHLITNSYTCITFNAWENDFTENPFLTIIGEISTAIEKKKNLENPIQRRFARVKKHAAPIAKHVVKLGVKLTTGISLNLDDNDVEKDIGESIGNITASYVEQYQESKKSISKFKESLQEFTNDIKESTEKPLVIFIDELDRCRPDYTIGVLETIKHFFNTKNIIFILAVDRKALKNSVASVFSSEINVDNYLRKFVDISLNLPVRNIASYTKNIANQTFSINCDRTINLFAEISALNNANLRTIEQTLSFYKMIIITKNYESEYKRELLGFLIALKVYYPEKYQQLKDNKVFQVIKDIASNTSLKKLLQEKEIIYAMLFGASVPKSKFNNLRTIFNNICLSPDEQRRSIVMDYTDIPFTEETLEEILKELEIKKYNIRNRLDTDGKISFLFISRLSEILSDIDFVENYST
ncbi:P-loop NTPase fold protein [Arcobacter sp. F2176]|uniref:KAP family P-loop NTPase fold protein n=1 Tax=Arcobacter sp. F2176 TaxID=2044511 RepID=UPI00100B849A|nr:P-loop NTPase fold protein [Arcobacter sp. F2176]RXJ82437.1 hypothetical protein CRU95_02985 [Arcobacter sp. F2176]